MAVLEKRVGLQLSDCDAYVNVTGGLKLNEPALDLGIVMAVVSSFKNRPVSSDVMVFGEVGLSGEVRAVTGASLRVQEAKRLGFNTVILPKSCLKGLDKFDGIKIIGVESVSDVVDLI